MGWIIVLCVAAILGIAALLIRAHGSYRRGSGREPDELPGQWEAEHHGYIEGQEFRSHGDGGWGQG